MNKTAMENKKLELEEKKLQEEKRAHNMQAVTNTLGAVIGAGAKVASAGMKPGKSGDWAPKGKGSRPRLAFNDPAWYKRLIGTTPAVSTVPTYFVQGLKEQWDHAKLGDFKVAAIQYYNTLGNQISAAPTNDGIAFNDAQYALSYFYAQTLQNNSRTPTEEPPEFGLYLFCWTEIMSILERAKLAISLTNVFEDQNPTVGRNIVMAMGLDPDDIVRFKADYIVQLNTLINEFNINAAIPKGMNYYARKMYLAHALIRDMKSNVAAFTVYRQIKYWALDDVNNTTKLIDFGFGYDTKTLSTWFSNVRTMMLPLKEAAISVNIKANILSAVDKSNLEIISIFADANEFYKTCLIDSDLEREQMGNITTIPAGFKVDDASLNLRVSETGYLYQGTTTKCNVTLTPVASSNVPTVSSIAVAKQFATKLNVHNHYLNFYHTDITPDDILESSRFKYQVDASQGDTDKLFMYVTSCGTELVDSIMIGNVHDFKNKTFNYVRTVRVESILDAYKNVGARGGMSDFMITNFDWSPLIFYYDDLVQGGSWNADGTYLIIGDVGKCVKLDSSNITKINSTANKSLFALDPRVFKQGF